MVIKHKKVSKNTNKYEVIDNHNIDSEDISENALHIIYTLKQYEFTSYIVGGAVRDLLLGIKPKDFDVATSATPPQINKIFPKSRTIGKRFQIVLVPFYSSRDTEIVEVTTFRAQLNKQEATIVKEKSKIQHTTAPQSTVTIDSSGQVWRDNVWGTHAEDASRRDFTINALYYDAHKNVIYDFYNGVQDLYNKTIRLIGDAEMRYKEDPVRIIRLARFAAKTNFNIEKSTLEEAKKHVESLNNIPPARLSDELLKMITSGSAVKCMQKIKELGAEHYVLPWHNDNSLLEYQQLINLVLEKTDQRLAENKSISTGFIFASIYWPQVEQTFKKLQEINNLPNEHMLLAGEQVTKSLSLQRKTITDMQEIWAMQIMLERRLPSKIQKILIRNKFRAAYDFLVLRAEINQELKELAQWWTYIQTLEIDQQNELIKKIKHIKKAASPKINKSNESNNKNSEVKAEKKPRKRRKTNIKIVNNNDKKDQTKETNTTKNIEKDTKETKNIAENTDNATLKQPNKPRVKRKPKVNKKPEATNERKV